MEQKNRLCPPKEPIPIVKPLGRSARRFLSFLICAAILVAAFAVSGAWMKRAGGDFLNGWGSFLGGKSEEESEAPEENGSCEPQAPESTEQDSSSVPSDKVVSLDLSHLDFGMNYLCNETLYRPDVEELRGRVTEGSQSFDPTDGPVVLILHTHATEAYSVESGAEGDAWYTDDPGQSVVSVGAALCQALNENGIPAIHCAEMHGESGTLRNSYAKAADCIEEYLERYPTIVYLIDVHRDGLLNGDGEVIRTLASGDGKPMAQVMAVVGTDGNGDEHPLWQDNLSLALRLRDRLESAMPSVSRPILLRNATYNQERVPNALLLEIGSAGNTVEEAIRAARLVGKSFAECLLVG